MEHTYLLRPGRWRAEGTYYDETGRSFPLAGETELVQEGAERQLDGWLDVSGPDSRTAMSSGRRTAPVP